MVFFLRVIYVVFGLAMSSEAKNLIVIVSGDTISKVVFVESKDELLNFISNNDIEDDFNNYSLNSYFQDEKGNVVLLQSFDLVKIGKFFRWELVFPVQPDRRPVSVSASESFLVSIEQWLKWVHFKADIEKILEGK